MQDAFDIQAVLILADCFPTRNQPSREMPSAGDENHKQAMIRLLYTNGDLESLRCYVHASNQFDFVCVWATGSKMTGQCSPRVLGDAVETVSKCVYTHTRTQHCKATVLQLQLLYRCCVLGGWLLSSLSHLLLRSFFTKVYSHFQR